jgi:LPS export ABC transporter protein LptC
MGVSGTRRWIAIGLAVAAALFAVWALLRGPASEPTASARRETQSAGPAASPTATPTPRPAALPPVRVERTAISTVDASGRPQWEMRAQTVALDGNTGIATLTGVAGIYYEAGQRSATITAARGVLTIATRNVVLSGGVHAESTSGRTLDARTVKWFPGRHQVEAEGAVILRQRGMTVRADRMVADISLQRTRMSGNIKVTMHE